MEIALVLGLLVLAIVLFATEKLSVDVITLLLLSALVLTGVLTPTEAFAGFSSDIIVILGSIFVIGGALRETGVLDVAGRVVFKLAGGSSRRLLVVGGVARRARISASKLLIPLAYASGVVHESIGQRQRLGKQQSVIT